MNKYTLRNRIIQRLRRIQSELNQTIADKRSWNDNRQDQPPFDLGWDIVMLDAVTKHLEAWKANDMEAVNRCVDKMFQLADECFR